MIIKMDGIAQSMHPVVDVGLERSRGSSASRNREPLTQSCVTRFLEQVPLQEKNRWNKGSTALATMPEGPARDAQYRLAMW